MTSLFSHLFLALQEQIKKQVPEIKWIDLDLGQLDFYDERPKVTFPCVLIDFPDAIFKDEHQNVQWGELIIHFKMGFSPFSSANSLAPDITKEKALDFYEIESKVYQALQQFEADGQVQPLTRIRATTEKRSDPYRVRLMIMTTATEDDAATIPIVTKKAGLHIDHN